MVVVELLISLFMGVFSGPNNYSYWTCFSAGDVKPCYETFRECEGTRSSFIDAKYDVETECAPEGYAWTFYLVERASGETNSWTFFDKSSCEELKDSWAKEKHSDVLWTECFYSRPVSGSGVIR